MNIKVLHERVDALKTALANEKEWREKMSDADLDLRLAQRQGDAAAIAEAQSANSKARTEWYGYYQACQDQSKGLVRHVGFEPNDIKTYL